MNYYTNIDGITANTLTNIESEIRESEQLVSLKSWLTTVNSFVIELLSLIKKLFKISRSLKMSLKTS